MRYTYGLWMALALVSVVADDVLVEDAVHPPTSLRKEFSQAEPGEALAGGATTTFVTSDKAFSKPAKNLPFMRLLDFEAGNGLFRRHWIPAPASVKASDGLGPLLNSRACQNCHIKDGRGHPPHSSWPEDNAVSLIIKLGIAPSATGDLDHLLPDPIYGTQLQDGAILGHQPRGTSRSPTKPNASSWSMRSSYSNNPSIA